MNFGDPRLPERFWAKVSVSEDGCWLWTAALTAAGYGSYSHEGKVQYAHRVAFATSRSVIPPGLELDHLCRVRSCCNPAHLEAVTHAENLLRGETLSARASSVVACPLGHPYEGDNLFIDSSGGRVCRTCKRRREREGHARRRSAQGVV